MKAVSVRRIRRRVDGVLLLDKPLGLSSNAALQRVKRCFAAEKAGHTGTLDPLATGLLPICLGEATKFAQVLLDAGKTYVATVRFGYATTTGDAEGEAIEERPVAFEESALRATLQRFVGVILQQPPRYAALKLAGRNYYEYAREGIEIPRVPREVTIEAITLRSWAPPIATIEVACGKGTYIRVLAEDLARALGSAAHLAALRRTAAGPFSLASAVELGALEALPEADRGALLLPIDAPIVGLPRLAVDASAAASLRHGQVPQSAGTLDGLYRCYEPDGAFIGLVSAVEGDLRSVRMVREPPRHGNSETATDGPHRASGDNDDCMSSTEAPYAEAPRCGS
jgi:tRNA pseudouridine55 synthase